MIPHISTTNHIHWVDQIKIEIYPLTVEGQGTNQIVKIRCYAEDHIGQDCEITIFTNHENVQVEMSKRKIKGCTILIDKEEGKNGGRKK